MFDAPSYISLSGLFKARPSEEGDERVLYMEASNEQVDLKGERVLAKSLQDSSDHFLRYGNIDLDHRTLMPPRPGDNPYQWEIGHPVAVSSDQGRTLVKAVLYRGDGPLAANANLVWESMTRLSPPARWYPSVGGQVLERGEELDPLTKAAIPVIRRVLWTNIGLSRTPVNSAVSPVSTIPVEVFAKCLTADGCLDLTKALEAGYGTDSATLSGGGALRSQSLEPKPQATLPVSVNYYDAREVLSRMVRSGTVDPTVLAARLTERFSLSPDEAARWVERFLRDLRAHHTPRGNR
jgi:hypothetical protein